MLADIQGQRGEKTVPEALRCLSLNLQGRMHIFSLCCHSNLTHSANLKNLASERGCRGSKQPGGSHAYEVQCRRKTTQCSLKWFNVSLTSTSGRCSWLKWAVSLRKYPQPGYKSITANAKMEQTRLEHGDWLEERVKWVKACALMCSITCCFVRLFSEAFSCTAEWKLV